MTGFSYVSCEETPCRGCGNLALHQLRTPFGYIPICQSCAGALKAVLPDAPDWERAALTAAEEVENKASWFRMDGGTNKHQRAHSILEAAQRLVEATSHLQEGE